jgi:hypothetical protein
MRTTVTLDADVVDLLHKAMRERGLTFKQAINDAIRAGIASPRHRKPKPFATYDMGEPLVNLTKALRIAGELEDQELVAKLVRGA